MQLITHLNNFEEGLKDQLKRLDILRVFTVSMLFVLFLTLNLIFRTYPSN